ncbi:MAG TPA: hypothetical protein VFN37_08615 [Candidatus Baltobacteraceae bacterium]|nr:hypothetical protein [Candidatus Baltobacteraceae bacterium]
MRQRGTSLIELVIVVAVTVLIAVALWALPQGARSFGMASAASQFDSAIAYAQALAANSGNGATIVFDQRLSEAGSPAGGFTLTVYSGRPTAAGALEKAPMAPMTSSGDVRETRLGNVPFTIFLDSAGHASGMSGAVTAASMLASDPGCPAGESSVVLTFSDPRTSSSRTIACNSAVAGQPIIVATVAPDTPASPVLVSPVPSPSVTPAAPTPAATPTPRATPTPALTPSPTPAASQIPTPTPTPAPAPTPNPLCTPDGLGWCAALAFKGGRSVSCYYWNQSHTRKYRVQQYEASTTYDVYDRGLLLYVDKDTWVWNGDCPPTSRQEWTPGEPRVQSGDPNLP